MTLPVISGEQWFEQPVVGNDAVWVSALVDPLHGRAWDDNYAGKIEVVVPDGHRHHLLGGLLLCLVEQLLIQLVDEWFPVQVAPEVVAEELRL